MEKTIKALIKVCGFWLGLSPLLAFLYLLIWVIQFFPYDWFDNLDAIFGLFPNILNALFFSELQLYGVKATMGYIYAAVVLVLSFVIVQKIEKKLIDLKVLLAEKQTEKNIKNQRKLKQEIIKREKPSIPNITQFYGLCDIKVEHQIEDHNQSTDLNRLRLEYLKMLKKKLENIYPNMQFILQEKLFIVSEDFKNFDSLLKSIVQLFEIFQKLNNDKSIETKLLISFDAGNKNTNTQYVMKLLARINSLRNFNKIIALEKFAQRYEANIKKGYSVIPSGVVKIFMEDLNDMDVEIYNLKKN